MDTKNIARRAELELPALCESAASFLVRLAATRPRAPLVEGLVAADGLTVWHGDPRTLKSWLALDVAIGVAAGVPVAGVLRVPEAACVVYASNEDPAPRVAERLRLLCAGRGLSAPPAGLHLAVHRGLWLDDEASRDALVDETRRLRCGLVILDPLRSLTACVDGTPRELQPLALYLRRLQREAGCAVLGVHHDTKPLPDGRDARARPHRMSGGALFSISDAPVHCERLPESETVLLTPSHWKHAADPARLRVTLTVGAEAARLVATPATEADGNAEAARLGAAVLDCLRQRPASSGRQLVERLHARRDRVAAALERLAQQGAVAGEPRGRARLWSIATPEARR